MTGTKKQWAVIRQKSSKGDLYLEETVEVFDDETLARASLEARQKSAGGTFQEWVDYILREIQP
ncbi:hypothetical protein KBA41_15755 [Candidatus Ozemobacteraceae bacterium]|nr:hypothetical protein [Candidatus Ozemobacteraceae bacterium]